MTINLKPAATPDNPSPSLAPATTSQLAEIKVDLGLDQVNNTPDSAKPVSGPQAAAIAEVAQAVSGVLATATQVATEAAATAAAAAVPAKATAQDAAAGTDDTKLMTPAKVAAAIAALAPGGAASGVPSTSPAGTTVSLNATLRQYEPLTISGAMTITVTGNTLGAVANMIVVANGTNIPTISGATEWMTSFGYLNTANVPNLLNCWFDGVAARYAWSQEAVPTALPSTPVVPTAPASFTAGAVTTSTQVLNWTPPTLGAPAVYTYNITYRVNGSGAFPTTPQLTGLTGLTTTVGGLSASTAYDYLIVAVNTAGTSPAATLTNLSTPATLALPGAVGNLAAGTPTTSSVALTWAAPSAGGGSITDYIVQYAAAGTSFSAPITFSDGTAATTGATITGLTAGTAYDFRVAAFNATGTGPYSAVLNISTAASSGGGSDADVDAWLARVATASGTVSGATEAAVRSFVASAKTAGYWATVRRLNLMCGDAAASLVPLVGTTADTNVGTTYSESTGRVSNGTSQYVNTGHTPTEAVGGLSVYLRTAQASSTTFRIPIGTRDTGTQSFRISGNTGANGTATAGSVAGIWGGAAPGPFSATTGGLTAGLWHAVRRGSTDASLYKDGVSVSTSATATTPASPGQPFYLFCQNGNGTAGAYLEANSQIAAYAIDSGMTDAQAADYRTHMQTFQTALGRAV